MRVKKTVQIFARFLFLGVLFLPFQGQAIVDPTESLPDLLEITPKRLYQILGPVGATKKKVSEAREQLRREAKKLDADAVLGVSCQEPGIRRQGLTWNKYDAYCRGMAVRFLDEGKGDKGP